LQSVEGDSCTGLISIQGFTSIPPNFLAKRHLFTENRSQGDDALSTRWLRQSMTFWNRTQEMLLRGTLTRFTTVPIRTNTLKHHVFSG
jgi:hypothetical protein